MSIKVKRSERGWAGHFCVAHKCLFRRNTLLEAGETKIVVSTVGLLREMTYGAKIEEVGLGRIFETMAFHSRPEDTRYHDADVSRQVYFNSPWAIAEKDADDRANEMHEVVVAEITQRLMDGETFNEEP